MVAELPAAELYFGSFFRVPVSHGWASFVTGLEICGRMR